MVLIDTQPEKLSPLESAYRNLDAKTKGPCGMTTKERCKYIIKVICLISDSTFYEWLKKPELINQRYRYDISVILNIDVKELFPKEINHN